MIMHSLTCYAMLKCVSVPKTVFVYKHIYMYNMCVPFPTRVTFSGEILPIGYFWGFSQKIDFLFGV